VSSDFGGNQAKPGEVESQYGLVSALARPQATVFGKDAYPTIAEKAAVFVWALLQNGPFTGGNRRLALAALFAFLELNGKSIDSKAVDEKALETLIKRASNFEESGTPAETAFHDLRGALMKAIV
jgi:death-on-curing protein